MQRAYSRFCDFVEHFVVQLLAQKISEDDGDDVAVYNEYATIAI